ncbi:uncharacterized protein LOC117642977 [Thrips palmi]|uniref:Uncharacterized protein LOC117642977 n=1 Tax=Thrips palmi TaxID=161013 RepID=A0A6P8YL80_THRPL|nr:uncharacterized protein LOC117642977 [Thrips palmi]
MSPKSLFFLLAVGLCATQMVSAHREARGIAEFFNTAKNKLSQLLHKAEDPILSSINTVKQYINNLENKLLESGTTALNKAGLQVNLTDLADLVKDTAKTCAKDEKVKAGAKVILNDMASCVVKDVTTLQNLIEEMEDLWDTARTMPSAIKDVANRCKTGEAVPADPLQLTVTLDTSDHELAEASNELLVTASKHLSKRALFDLSRVTNCVKNIFDFAKNDLVSIPGDVITAATHAYQVVQSVQGGIPACVAKKATENVDEITKLGLEVGACLAAGVADGDLSTNPSLRVLKQLSVAADALNRLQDSSALSAAGQITQYLG